PLAFWRNEHIEYGYEQTESGAHVPKVKNIVRVRKTAEEKSQARRRRQALSKQPLPSLRGITRSELDLNDRDKFYYYDDENYGFPVSSDRTRKFGPRAPKHAASAGQKRVRDEDDDNDDIAFKQQLCQVVRPDGQTLVEQEVALARNSVEWVQMNDSRDKYRVAVGLYAEYSNGDVYANSGVLALPVGGAKPVRQSYERTMFYLVTAGKVEVTIRDAVMQVGILGQFIVPSGNSYGIKNIGTHPAQLYFVQIGVDNAAANGGAKIEDVQDEEAPEEDEGEEMEEADVGHFSDVSEEL
ncbi:mitotic fidelity of chromosome transmission- protein, partial [Linderina pennispora]